MEKNLNAAPTKQELDNAGFKINHKEGYSKGWYAKKLWKDKIGSIEIKDHVCRFWIGGNYTEIECTKQKINDAFALFNQPLPQWNKPKPKVGEVWGNNLYTFVIIKDEQRNVLKLEGDDLMGNWLDFETATYKDDQWKYLSKLADSLEDYYKEKFINKHMKK